MKRRGGFGYEDAGFALVFSLMVLGFLGGERIPGLMGHLAARVYSFEARERRYFVSAWSEKRS
jgi:hypothetical protein